METKLTATELMIGDWVQCVDSTHEEKTYAQIDAIEEGQRSILLRKGNTNWFLYIDFIEPIPLTAEVLGKNGFIKCLWDIYRLPKTDFSIEHTGGLFILRISNERLCEVKSVSHLQHLLRDFNVDKEIVL